MKSIFSISKPPLLKVTGRNHWYPVRRIFCVGRNYIEHVLELGNAVEKKTAILFY
jgi:fumarylpyruvate hydrolase